jgi:DMSO/TMAO reductase YedYZ molybdopterin-dependent catalytic subunit
MEQADVSRRTLLKGGGAVAAGMSVWQVAGQARASGAATATGNDLAVADRRVDPGNIGPPGTVLEWLDQPAAIPDGAKNVVGDLLVWEQLNSFFTRGEFFWVQHYGQPPIPDPQDWRLRIDGLVDRPTTLSLADLKRRARRAVDFTLECSGNTGLPFFIGGIGTARWAGASLAPLLRRAGIQDGATEVVFWGADKGTVTIRDNGGITSGGRTGIVEPDEGGALDLTITEQFARSMSVEEALSEHNLLCYEMNGRPLPPEHGSPVRLIAPGWYGVANVKWLTRIELRDQRFGGRFMARDYVTIREETGPGGVTVWTFATVGRGRLKSAPAKVVRKANNRHTIVGVAWGAPIAVVEVQIDDGPWRRAKLIGPKPEHGRRGFAWRFWSYEWGQPTPGEHRVTSRAYDVDGNRQPGPNDRFLAAKRTYWESNGWITRRVNIA